MTKAVAESVSIPLTVKTRLGWDHDTIVIEDTVQMLEQSGVAAIAIHCRTKSMGFKGTADWSWIEKVKKKVSIPIILNGDVVTPEDAKRAFDTTGCDGIMIGRAAVGNPFLFRNINEYLKTGRIPAVSVREKIDICLEHLKLTMQYKGDQRGLFEFRKHYSGYLKGLFNNSNIRQKVVLMESYQEIEDTLNDFYEYLKKEERLYSNQEELPEQEIVSCQIL
jgi:tRNA-dihydrouridine synthase B